MSKVTVPVLYCIESMLHGGTERQLLALIEGLDRTQFTPALCTLKPSKMDLRALDCPVIELGFHSFRSPSALRCVWGLRNFVDAHRIQVVQTFFQDPTLLAWSATLLTSVRARIATFRDMGFWRTPAKVRQLRLVYPHFDGFIANSTAVARHVHEADRIPLDAIEVIPNGVRIPSAVAPADANPLVVGIVANLDRPVKRVDLFVEAAARIHAAVPASTFVVVGDGPLRPALQDQAERLGLGHAMRFAGSTPTAMDEILRFSVGTLCSDSEGLSNALLEYMACGVPAVARNVGGNSEAIDHGNTGILVEDSTADALARAVIELLTDPARRQRMAARARQIAEERFSIPACVRRHQELYDRLLARATRGASASRSAAS